MNKLFLITVMLSSFSVKAAGLSLDQLIAKTALALGDYYSKEVKKSSKGMRKLLAEYPNLITSLENELPQGVTISYNQQKENIEKYKDLALKEYKQVFCTEDCPYTDPVTLPVENNYLIREAFSKYELLERGINTDGVVSRSGAIYAANSNFEEHLLKRLERLAQNQQVFDHEALRIKKEFADLEATYVDISGEIIGAETTLLSEKNYSLTNQTQIETYKSCVESASIENDYEIDEYQKTLAQYKLMVKNIKNNLDKIYDFSYVVSGSDTIFTVQSNLGWQQTDVVPRENDQLYFTATGYWNVKGAVTVYEKGDLYNGESKIVKSSKSLWRTIKKVVNVVFNPMEAIGTVIGAISGAEKLEQSLSLDGVIPFDEIKNKGFESTPQGYYFSFSKSLSNSQNSSESSNAGLSFYGANVGVGTSTGTGSSQTASSGGTYGLRFKTTAAKEYPLSALIGSFCKVNPANDSSCKAFIIGNSTFVEFSDNSDNLRLWVRANDNEHFSNNSGTVQLKIKKNTSFRSSYKQYLAWMNKECSGNGYDCGLNEILENIAYISDPFLMAESSFNKEFPDMAAEAKKILLQEVNYLVELKIIEKDLKSKEMSQELQDTKIGHCENQLELSKEQLINTTDMVALLSRRLSEVNNKKALLDVARRYYEQELVNINYVRERNLQRLKRYFELTVNAYNYLYLDDFSVNGEPSEYMEGLFYAENVELLKDLIFEITAVNDLLNPNRSFVVYELSKDEMANLQSSDYRKREIQLRLDMNDFFCKGYNLEDQSRVMIEKVGVLLDIDPVNEYLFFKNSNRRSTKVSLTHGTENRFFDFSGDEVEYWMPAQRRQVDAYSSRILVDANSDYQELRDSRYFERLSFRKTSFSTTWNVEMKNSQVQMYLDEDINNENPLLKGMKLVFWLNSTEFNGGNSINSCLYPPHNVQGLYSNVSSPKVSLSWEFDTTDEDFSKINRFQVYRSKTSGYGDELIGHLNISDAACSASSSTMMTCTFDDESLDGLSGSTLYYQVRSSYRPESGVGSYRAGVSSREVSVDVL